MPRWSDTKQGFVQGDAVTPVASAARTANADSGWLSAEDIRQLALTLNVTAVTGTTPTLDVVVETASDSSGTNTRAVTGSPFAQKTAVAAERKSFTGFDRFYRVRWTIGGTATPTFTFSVTGDAK